MRFDDATMASEHVLCKIVNPPRQQREETTHVRTVATSRSGFAAVQTSARGHHLECSMHQQPPHEERRHGLQRVFFRRSCPSEDAPAENFGRPRLRAPRAPKELGSTAIRKSRLSLPGKRRPPSAVLLATEHWLSRRVVRVLRVLVVRGIKPGQVKPSQV